MKHLIILSIFVVLNGQLFANDLSKLKQQLLDSQQEAAQYKQELVDIRSAIHGAIGNKKTVSASYLKALIDPFKSDLNPDCRLSGKVIKVADGDSITVLDNSREQHKIRFSGIDAPEIGQPYGKAAKKFLSKIIYKKQVCVQWHKKDKYGRLVGLVFYEDKDVNLQVVEAGYAWHFKKFQSEQAPADRKLYAEAHDKAKSDVIGLWSEPDPISPDDWRAGTRQKKKTAISKLQSIKQSISPADQFSCGAKRFCSKMTSCAEACFYLAQCGLTRLDRDKDGIPCEKLCSRQCE